MAAGGCIWWKGFGMGLSTLGEPGRGSGSAALGKGGCAEFSVSPGTLGRSAEFCVPW